MAGRLSDQWEESGELRPLDGSVPPPKSEGEKDTSDMGVEELGY